MTLRIHLTDRLAVDEGETLLESGGFPARQGRLAFAYLAMNRRPVPRDELADRLWGDAPPKSWERDLSAIVSKLRTALGRFDPPPTIDSAFGCYELRLPSDAEVDVETAGRSAEEAEAALSAGQVDRAWSAASVAANIARRPFLPGEDAAWIDERRAHLQSVLLRALDVLVDVHDARGETGPALRYAAEGVDLEPFRESGYVRLMRLHLAAGDRAEALRAYERCRTLLVEELGVDPSPVTEAAYLEALGPERPATPEVRDPEAAPPTGSPPSGTVTLLFTDLVGSTELLDALGAHAADRLRVRHFAVLREAISDHSGHEVKNLGDGLMVAFGTAREAVTCAVAIQRAQARENVDAETPLAIRIGLHTGDVTCEDGDYFGPAVVIAQRLCSVAGAGQILVSQLAADLAGNVVGPLNDVEPKDLKGLSEPVTAGEVDWRAAADQPLSVPAPLVALQGALFVGRDEEVSGLERVLHEATQQGGRLVLVAGEAGIGKTTLVGQFALLAHGSGHVVVLGRCDAGAHFPYGPFVDGLDRLLGALSDDDLRFHAGRGAPDLVRLLPRLGDRLTGLPAPAPGEPDTERHRLFEAVTGFASSLSALRPVVLVLEDLHWADPSTLLLLRHLVRGAGRARLLVVGTYRASEVGPGHPLSEAVSDLRRDDLVREVPLSGLEDEDLLAVVAEAGVASAPLAGEIARATEGNPFFAREIARHLSETRADSLALPPGVREVIESRVACLAEDARGVLALASVIGREFSLDLLERVAGRSENELVDLLDRAAQSRLIVDVPGSLDCWTFSHALVRETLYETISASRRARVHRDIAAALEEADGHRRGSLGDLAYHFCAAGPAGDLDKAVEYACRAGEAAMDQLAYEDASAHFDRALHALRQGTGDRTTEAALLLALGEARARSSDERAGAAYLAAVELARDLVDAELLAEAALGATSPWAQTTGAADTDRMALLDEALAALGEEPTKLRAALLGRIATELWLDPRSEERRDTLSRQAVAVAEAVGDDVTLAEAIHARNTAAWHFAAPEERVESGRHIVRLAQRAGHLELALKGHVWCEIGSLDVGDVAELDRALAAYESVAEELGQPRYTWYALIRRSMRATLGGNLDEGDRLAREAIALGLRLGEADAQNTFTGMMWPVWLERPTDEAADYVDALLEEWGTHWNDWFVDMFRAFRMWGAYVAGRPDRAQVDLEHFRSRGLVDFPRHHIGMLEAICLAGVVADLGTEDEIRLVYEALLPRSGQAMNDGGCVSFRGAYDQWLGVLALGMGRYDDAVDLFTAATSLHERMGARAFLARSRLGLAEALLGRGDLADVGRVGELLELIAAADREMGLPVLGARAAELSPAGAPSTR